MQENEQRDRSLSPDRPDLGAYPAQCPVVGLGASAGGLEAFQTFLAAASSDAGLAYVLVQHLDPNHESMLADLLGRRTKMPVRQIADGMAIEPNNVYLIPPNASLVIEKARLRLSDFSEPRGFRRPIDVFFRSLAIDQGANAACVVLSGTGADGSEGLRAVKEAGGLTLVQEPASAKYDGMPNNALATGLVDNVLPVAEMPAALHEYFQRGQAPVLRLDDVSEFLLKVCEEVRGRLGHDFSHYKRSTMLRRIQRRMQVIGASATEDYLRRLREDADEARLLFRDLLINVTCFFRDADAFDYLRREVIPDMIQGKGAGDTIRVWAPGCSSGEEAYSIAILFAEALGRTRKQPSVQIFATDIDEAMLQKARAARYPQSAARDVPIELLDRYFYADDDDLVLVRPIRDMVRVSNHNVIKDPPFSRVDMIVCRNLLIYLNASLQQRLIPVFHYSLKPTGWLFLGSAENIAARSDLFDSVEPALRIYRRRGSLRQSVPMPLVENRPLDYAPPKANPVASGRGSEAADAVTRRVIDRYAPAFVVINEEYEILYSSPRTGKFLELNQGPPSRKVTDLAKRGLRSALRGAVAGAQSARRRLVKSDVRVEVDADAALRIDLIADPLNESDVLLVFKERSGDIDADGDAQVDLYSDEERIQQLEEDLDETRLRLRTTVEELETSNEELKSSNEEMMSMNEELQSANEELATINEELKNKVDLLARTNSDLHNFIESTQVPTVFLDCNMRVRSFTPASKALFRFGEQDHGRLFSDVSSRVDHELLNRLSRKVLETGESVEEELVLDGGDEIHVLRVLPYRGVDNAIEGAILVFSDITKIRQAMADAARSQGLVRQRVHEIETLYETAPVGMAMLDRNRRFLRVNQHFADLAGETVEELMGRSLPERLPMLAERIEGPLKDVFEEGKRIANLEAPVRVNGSDHLRDFLIDLYAYEEDEKITAAGLVVKDVSELRRLEKELRRLMDELQHRVKNTLATVVSIVNQTGRTKGARGDVIDTLKARIEALAATHNLLTASDWREASLSEILKSELSPYDARRKIALRGPEVQLPPKHALTLTLAVHELATNAAKYGALAHDSGALSVEWVVNVDADGRALSLEWTETGVPAMPSGKVKSGFGTKLIKSAVVHDLQGQCEYTLAPSGLRCVIRAPY